MEKKRNSNSYIDNVLFYKLLCERRAIINKLEDISDKASPTYVMLQIKGNKVKNELGRIFLKLCQHILTKPNFINYSPDRKDAMTSDACWYCSRYIDRYDVARTNPFGYFTTVCHHAFLQFINKQKKYSEKFQPIGYIENIHKKNNSNDDIYE